MENVINLLLLILDSHYFLLTVVSILFIVKTYILAVFIRYGIQDSPIKKTWLCLLIVLLCSMISDSAWIITLLKMLVFGSIDYRIVRFWTRIAWGCTAIQYQGLSLFLESLVEKNYTIGLRQKIFVSITSTFSLFFIGLSLYNFNCLEPGQRPAIELIMEKLTVFYVLFPLMLSSVFLVWYKIMQKGVLKILKKQFKTLLLAVIIPYWITDFLEIYEFSFSWTLVTNSNTFVSLSKILLTYALFYCARKVMGFRFLNFKGQVESRINLSFMPRFKTILEQLSHVTNEQELKHITQRFFKDLFHISLNYTKLYIRKNRHYPHEKTVQDNDAIMQQVETFIHNHEKEFAGIIKKSKILIYDEIVFSNFYNQKPEYYTIATFLEAIQADVFLPIFQKEHLVAYIIVERNAHPEKLYSRTEQDQMLVFTNYLENIINLLQNKNFDMLIRQEKELQEEVYQKHQEINQYKESIHSFLRIKKQNDIGIILYKDHQFTFGNHVAKELINVNLNHEHNHPITKDLEELVRKVTAYKSPQTILTKDSQNNPLVLAAIPHFEQNNIIICVHHPEISHILNKQLELLADPDQWDYLLYLETTHIGKLINELIPGSGETLLNVKVELLKIALSKKAVFLDVPDNDLLPIAQLLHRASLREQLHILDLQGPSSTIDIGIKLFGIDPVFGSPTTELPLLAKLNETGSILIKNIHFLDLETQNHLADFIRYGVYQGLKSEQKKQSNVRIIASTNQNTRQLVQEGTFSQTLLDELNKSTLSIPSLMTLPEVELTSLADGFAKQVANKITHQLPSLTHSDKNKLIHNRPTSLNELKTRIQHMLAQKSKQHENGQDIVLEPAFGITDPELLHAAQLGKQALKNPKMMRLLWDKFKNQNKIALFLGVNRSTVNRRCKEYNLQ